MITPLATIFGTTLMAFVLFALLSTSEQRRGKRLVLAGVRGWLDAQVSRLELALGHLFDYIARRVIKFTWYYSLHSFFRGMRALLEKAYLYVEHRMHLHHRRAWTARKGGGGSGRLGEIAEHKQSIALSEEEKRQRREQSLEG